MRGALAIGLLFGATVALLPAQQPDARVDAGVQCAADLGSGVASGRRFCDVIIGATASESIVLPVPAHDGAATLSVDLHNRFTVPTVSGPPAAIYARHGAVVRVVTSTGEVLGRGAVVREFRTVADLFDQIAGGSRPGGIKAVAPGPAEAVRFSVPAGIDMVGIVGTSLTVLTRAGGAQTFDTPGRPIAMASNVRLAFRP